MIRKVDDSISVAPQIQPADIAVIKAAGFVAVVNNRPDDEQEGQPAGDEIRAAALAAGLTYAAIPVGGGGFSHRQVAAMVDVLESAEGPVLAFCRSGTRSCNLWALARARMGDTPDELIAKGAGAGYDLDGLRPLLDQLAAQA
ncbi:MAG: TIGR01244 family phosphatase [Sphingomonas sp.]|uniref:TIGR01244 family sulfur transferase n=1 Tax=Sphingomonas sp. TaxID=28214 RepID=UPI00122A38B4|nr:TIGR01244 family sulfur transferase [Sphingomonas sp.]THD36137.1 MAG: TIGR01244 family phosphatase [Sphingomonas sp.]